MTRSHCGWNAGTAGIDAAGDALAGIRLPATVASAGDSRLSGISQQFRL
jgi:hypothetical protein